MSALTLEDLGRVVVPGSPAPWGDRLVYALRRLTRDGKRTCSSLWAVPVAGGPPTRLTQGDHGDRMPLPGPGFLLFASDRERGDQLWILDASGGEARRISSFGPGRIGPAALSPDGRVVYLVFSAQLSAVPLATERHDQPAGDEGPEHFGGPEGEGEYKAPDGAPVARVYARALQRMDGAGWDDHAIPHLWRLDVATGEARRLTRGPFAYGALAVSPCGGFLVATRVALPHGERDLTRNELVRVDVTTGDVAPVPHPDGLADTPAVSPDGRRVAYVWVPGDDRWGSKNPLVGVTDLHTGAAALLGAALDRPVGDWGLDDVLGGAFLPWAPRWDGDGVVVMAGDRAATRLLRLGLDGACTWLTGEGAAVSSPVALGGGRFGALHGAPDQLPELARVEPGGDVVRLTDHNAALAGLLRLPECVEVERDGVTLQGWYLPPRDASAPAPAILYVHGGPHTAYGARAFFEMQWLATQGFAVLWTNPRGSHTFGEAYCGCIDGHWGDPDGGDQVALVDWMAARPEVDGARVGVAGGSYGGYMALYLAGTTDRFRAAVAERGLYDWALASAGGDVGFDLPATLGLPPFWEAPAAWAERSLLPLAKRVRIPMLVTHGEGDLRATPVGAYALHEALQLAGVPTALLLFPDESHGMSRGGRLDRRVERLRQIAAWFRRWL